MNHFFALLTPSSLQGSEDKRASLFKLCFFSTFFWGLLAHGAALVTKFTFQDEVSYLFGVGSTVASGRWFLGVLGWLVRTVFGSPNFSLPLLGGLMILLLCCICSFQILSLLNIRQRVACFLSCGLVVTFPTTCSLFFYNFTAPYYLVGMCLTLAGTGLLCKKRSAASFCLGVLLVVLGTATYQAYIAVFLCLLLMHFIRDVSQRTAWTFADLWKAVVWYCGASIVMILVYLLSVKVSTALCGQALVSYKGLSDMGSVSVLELLQRAKLAVYLFLFPKKSNPSAYLLPYRMIWCYYLCLAGLALLGGLLVLRNFRKAFWKGLSLLLALACFPLASNFIFVMCDPDEVYNLMQVSSMMPFFLLLLLAELLLPEVQAANWGKKCILALLAVFCIFSLRVDNAAYEKGALMQDRIQQYFTVMIAQIRSTPGYTASTPVAYVGDPDAFGDTTFHQITGFAELPIAPLRYDSTPFSIGNTWEKFLDLRCGFTPPKADPEDYADLPEVQAMPCYPDYGSIQLINGTVVVKLKN